jgi:hypothetical protein
MRVRVAFFRYWQLLNGEWFSFPEDTPISIQPDPDDEPVLRTRQCFTGFEDLKQTALKADDIIIG